MLHQFFETTCKSPIINLLSQMRRRIKFTNCVLLRVLNNWFSGHAPAAKKRSVHAIQSDAFAQSPKRSSTLHHCYGCQASGNVRLCCCENARDPRIPKSHGGLCEIRVRLNNATAIPTCITPTDLIFPPIHKRFESRLISPHRLPAFELFLKQLPVHSKATMISRSPLQTVWHRSLPTSSVLNNQKATHYSFSVTNENLRFYCANIEVKNRLTI